MQPLSPSSFCSNATLGTVFAIGAVTLVFWRYFRNSPSEPQAQDRDITTQGNKVNASNVTAPGNLTVIAKRIKAIANVIGAQAPKESIRAITVDPGVSHAQLDALL